MLQRISEHRLQILLYRPKHSDGLMVLPNQRRNRGNPIKDRRKFCRQHFGITLRERSVWTTIVPAKDGDPEKDISVYRIEHPETEAVTIRQDSRYFWVDLESLCSRHQSFRIPWRFITAMLALEKDYIAAVPSDGCREQRLAFIEQAESLTGVQQAPKGTVQRLGTNTE
jgi:hypothetical protein